jgi:hypothetical protein
MQAVWGFNFQNQKEKKSKERKVIYIKPGMMAHIFNPSLWEDLEKGLRV